MFQFNYQRILLVLIIGPLLSACTTGELHLSIAPYTKDKQKRDELELIAEKYCQQKRNYPGATGVKKLPDFIFTTDGCSLVPDDSAWSACCIVHDIPYWCGGSKEDRRAADHFLEQCVNKKAADAIGKLYYVGVVLGGVPGLPTSWRWGYGWDDWPRDYEALEGSPTVMQLLNDLNAEQLIQEHLKNNSD